MKKLKSWPMAVVVMVVGAAVAITAFWFTGDDDVTYPGGGMDPTIPAGSSVRVRKVPGDQVHRGDVIMFVGDAWAAEPAERGLTLVKRVIGVGGDTVTGSGDGQLGVNGKPVTEDYRKKDDPDAGVVVGAFIVKVEPGEVFVAGDWRGNSRDSRTYVEVLDHHGGVPVKDISGFVVAVNGKSIAPTTAFTDAGLAGAPFHDDSSGGQVRLLVIAGGLALCLGGMIWLILALARRKT
jgi:signal peptidase I